MDISIENKANDDMEGFRKGSKPTYQKCFDLVRSIIKDGYNNGIGKPEHLKWVGPSIWARRVNDKDRMVYSVDTIKNRSVILYCESHYGDH